MSKMGRLAFDYGNCIQKTFPDKSWEECMDLAMYSSTELKNCAYVDGSYNPIISTYGGGGILFDQNGRITKFTVHGSNPDYVRSRNVAGEIEAVNYCLWVAFDQLLMEEITIFYDYEGIQKWPDGEWVANKYLTKKYVESIDRFRRFGKKIRFEKVKAHSGDLWNKEADRLAKAACENWRAIC